MVPAFKLTRASPCINPFYNPVSAGEEQHACGMALNMKEGTIKASLILLVVAIPSMQ